MIKFLDLQKITFRYQNEITEAVNRVIQKGWYLFGQEVQLFEKEYAEYCGSDYCIGVANGLDALKLIFRGYIELGILNEGDEVIVPANTYIASILSITENRLIPVLVDPDLNTYNIDPYLIESAITEKTKAIMIVHLYGRCAYHEKIKHSWEYGSAPQDGGAGEHLFSPAWTYNQINGGQDPQMLFSAEILEIPDAEKPDIRCFVPEIGQGFCDRRLAAEKQHPAGIEMGKIRESDNNPFPHPQRFLDNKVHLPYFLHALVKNHVIE